MRDERGFTVAELTMSIPVFLVILTAIMMMVQVATHGQDRVAKRVAANQRARPTLTRIMDNLHSACVAPGIAPIQANSGPDQLRFLSKTGSSVSPTPDLRVITRSGTTLREAVYPATGGAPPLWTFSGTPSSDRELLDGVGLGEVGGTTVPVFQYFEYAGGQLSTTPLQTPLSAADAATTVQVKIAFASYPTAQQSPDPNADITLADSATLRLEPASEDAAEVNLPCV